ncbi:MAG: TIGR03620 family F420-dependent LLM class oxidoreductase [Nitriliruptor sp.]|uniref:TIGR03620 family F420-dependent LLM class oxidoreductase n=1 Tax=Nitriliruptor sp. TaxID=2448056 RepID=UPI00349FF978
MSDAAGTVTELRARLGPVGIWSGGLDGLPVAEVGDLAREVERLGGGALWYGEAYGRESFAQAALCLDATSELVVGSSIASIYARDALAARGAQATTSARHPGRFVFGLGVSHAPLVERLRGHEYGKPLAAMRTYLEALDQVSPVVVDAGPARPRMLAALGPKMLELSAELADGALPYLTLPEHTAQAREIVGPDRLLVVEHGAVLLDDPDEARRRTHTHLEVYTGLPNYRASWTRQGFSEDDYVRGGSDRLKDAMVTVGLEATRDRIVEHLEAGADQVCVQVLGVHPLDADLGQITTLLETSRQEGWGRS